MLADSRVLFQVASKVLNFSYVCVTNFWWGWDVGIQIVKPYAMCIPVTSSSFAKAYIGCDMH
jgi:hypothetical protein